MTGLGLCTQGYPYFLQAFGSQSWDLAPGPRITLADAGLGSNEAIAELDQSFFRVRYDRLTPAERKYVEAMARLGEGVHRSGDIATEYGTDVQKAAPIRSRLIGKGMVYGPAHGDTAFTVPLFAEFVNRTTGTD